MMIFFSLYLCTYHILQLNKSVTKENENDMDMDKEDFMDWLGTSSVFTMAESSTVSKNFACIYLPG